MGRGVSSGGGQSSLGYLFGSGEAPKPAASNGQAAPHDGQAAPNDGQAAPNDGQAANNGTPPKPAVVSPPVDVSKQLPAGINSNSSDGQNTGNFITDRPSTKIQSAPGGGSSLGYLFGGNRN